MNRVLSHSKGSKIKVVASKPLPFDGQDGDIRMMPSYQNGAVLYVKVAREWFAFTPTKSTAEGYHGYNEQITIMPGDLSPASTVTSDDMVISEVGAWASNSSISNEFSANIFLPKGYEAYSVRMNYELRGSGSTPTVPHYDVYTSNVENTPAVSVLEGTLNYNIQNDIAFKSNTDSFLVIKCTDLAGTSYGISYKYHTITGGYIKIRKII